MQRGRSEGIVLQPVTLLRGKEGEKDGHGDSDDEDRQ